MAIVVMVVMVVMMMLVVVVMEMMFGNGGSVVVMTVMFMATAVMMEIDSPRLRVLWTINFLVSQSHWALPCPSGLPLEARRAEL